MADEPGTTPAASAPTEPPSDSGRTFTQADLDRVVQDRLAREQQKFQDYDDLKAKAERLAEIESAQQTDLERVTVERDELKNQLTPLQTENLRLRVAAEKKLPAELVDRLKGGTKEEMESDADELLKLVGAPVPPDFGGGPREPAPAGDMDTLIRRAAGRA